MGIEPVSDVTAIVELALTIATANWTNRVNDGLRTPMPA
jgi:alkylhydroperoxidase family enzyme